MFDNKMDILVVCIMIIAVSVVAGMSIVNMVERRISDVAVNIPPVKVPKPKVVLNLKADEDGNINIDEEKLTEGFIVADAQDMQNYERLKEETEKLADDFDTDIVVSPSEDRVVNYEDPNKDFSIQITYEAPKKIYSKDKIQNRYFSSEDFGWQAPNKYVSCANSSIAKKYKFGDKSPHPNQIACGHPNKLTAENWYKTHYRPQVIPIEDVYVKGYNYGEYSEFPSPYDVRTMRILSQNTKGITKKDTRSKNIPVGHNYAFHNTPALKMP